MATSFASLVKRFARDERGASLVEYAVLVALITSGLIAAVIALGGQIETSFEAITTVLSGNQAGGN